MWAETPSFNNTSDCCQNMTKEGTEWRKAETNEGVTDEAEKKKVREDTRKEDKRTAKSYFRSAFGRTLVSPAAGTSRAGGSLDPKRLGKRRRPSAERPLLCKKEAGSCTDKNIWFPVQTCPLISHNLSLLRGGSHTHTGTARDLLISQHAPLTFLTSFCHPLTSLTSDAYVDTPAPRRRPELLSLGTSISSKESRVIHGQAGTIPADEEEKFQSVSQTLISC